MVNSKIKVAPSVIKVMKANKSKDTKPELLVRKALFRKGLRYRINVKKLPGTPDIVFPKYKAVIMVNGCFWHGHNCRNLTFSTTKQAYWFNKIQKNRHRDRVVELELQLMGWRVMTIWECSLFGKHKRSIDLIVKEVIAWLNSNEDSKEITGFNK